MKSRRKVLIHAAAFALRLAAFLLFGVAVWGLLDDESPAEWMMDETAFRSEIDSAAARYDLPPELVRALILRESRFHAFAIGSKGEIGLMQLLPGTGGAVAEWARVNKRPAPFERQLFSVPVNLDIGCWYLSRAMRRWREYRCGTELALAEYNAGASRAMRWKPETLDGDVVSRITVPGTRRYVEYIMRHYRRNLENR